MKPAAGLANHRVVGKLRIVWLDLVGLPMLNVHSRSRAFEDEVAHSPHDLRLGGLIHIDPGQNVWTVRIVDESGVLGDRLQATPQDSTQSAPHQQRCIRESRVHPQGIFVKRESCHWPSDQ